MKNVIANRLSQVLRTVIVAASFAFIGLPAVTAQAGQPGQTCYFGECRPGVSAPVVAKTEPNDELRVVAKQGSWSVMSNGQMIVVAKEYDDGARFAIVKTREGYGMAFMDPTWKLREGDTFKVSIDIDGKTFSGQGTATSGTMMIVKGIRNEFISEFANGKLAKFEVAGVNWTVYPANAAAVIKAAANS